MGYKLGFCETGRAWINPRVQRVLWVRSRGFVRLGKMEILGNMEVHPGVYEVVWVRSCSFGGRIEDCM